MFRWTNPHIRTVPTALILAYHYYIYVTEAQWTIGHTYVYMQLCGIFSCSVCHRVKCKMFGEEATEVGGGGHSLPD